MGLDLCAEDILRAAKARGADLSRVAMLGRQRHGDGFAEPFFRSLGADSVQSIDYSAFEGAEIIHDMNAPLPQNLKGKFTFVFDGGTLEHIFNAPQALRTCIELLAPAGTIVHVLPGNNFMGHGFWQFSPELFYRVYSPANGFTDTKVMVQEIRRWWRRAAYVDFFLAYDPAELGWRVELQNHWQTNLAVIATRGELVEPFSEWPQQSDYSTLWNSDGQDRSTARAAGWKASIRRLIPEGGERLLRGRFVNKAYARIDRNDVLAGRF